MNQLDLLPLEKNSAIKTLTMVNWSTHFIDVLKCLAVCKSVHKIYDFSMVLQYVFCLFFCQTNLKIHLREIPWTYWTGLNFWEFSNDFVLNKDTDNFYSVNKKIFSSTKHQNRAVFYNNRNFISRTMLLSCHFALWGKKTRFQQKGTNIVEMCGK